jgi:protein subunit release factor B
LNMKYSPRWAIRLTHEPTGISVETTSLSHPKGSMKEIKERLLIQLKSKVHAMSLDKFNECTKFGYTLHETQYVDELFEYRREV